MRQLSLRTRLVLGVLVLAAAVLVGADFATYHSLRSFLIQRTDTTLDSAHHEVEAAETALLSRRGSSSGTRPSNPGAKPRPRAGGPPPASDLGSLARSLPGLFIELRSKTGKVLYKNQVPEFFRTTAAPPPPRIPESITLQPPTRGEPDRVSYFTAPATSGGGRYRVRASIDPGSKFLLIIATSLSGVDGTLHRLLLIELLVTGVGLAAMILLGLWVVRLGLRPLGAIERTAAAIGAGDLTRRVERAEPRTEVGRLGLALNAMLGQIEAAFKARAASEEALRKSEGRLRRFVADASHELRNPIAAVRSYAELFRRGADRRPEDLARAMTGISRESDRMSLLVEDLLLLAHLDEGRPLERKPVELEAVVFEAVETAHTVEPDRPIEVDVEQAVVLGDRERLRQVIDNLFSNIRAHTPSATPVRVSVKRSNGSALLEVEDSGPGMNAEDLERVFERFYRADPLRSRARGGSGLGLSIVAAVTRAHDGTISVKSDRGKGSTFQLTLPLLEDRPGGSSYSAHSG